jgi:hypothetical protein
MRNGTLLPHSGRLSGLYLDHAMYMTHMALTTPIRDQAVIDYIREKRRHHMLKEDWNKIASKFVE